MPAYDGLSRIISVTDRNGNGNLASKTDADGYVTEYSYSSLDLASAINYNDTKEVSCQYKITYNKFRKLRSRKKRQGLQASGRTKS